MSSKSRQAEKNAARLAREEAEEQAAQQQYEAQQHCDHDNCRPLRYNYRGQPTEVGCEECGEIFYWFYDEEGAPIEQ